MARKQAKAAQRQGSLRQTIEFVQGIADILCVDILTAADEIEKWSTTMTRAQRMREMVKRSTVQQSRGVH
jgi:hypothetical protein